MGWLVAALLLHLVVVSTRLFPKQLLGCGERKHVLAERSNMFHFDIAWAGTVIFNAMSTVDHQDAEV